jgi:hypothetical protein
MKLNLLVFLGAILIAGCSSRPPWLIEVTSSPVAARIYCGGKPTQYLGTTPCYANIPGGNAGVYWGQLKLWAIPVTNAPGVHESSATFGIPNPAIYVKLPSSLFFDLTTTNAIAH